MQELLDENRTYGRSAGSCKDYWTRTGRTLFQWDEKKMLSFAPPSFKQMRRWLEHQLRPAYIDEEWKTPRTRCAIQSAAAAGIETSCYVQKDMTQQRECVAAVLINKGFKGDFQWGQGGLLQVVEEPDRIRQSIGGRPLSSEVEVGVHSNERNHDTTMAQSNEWEQTMLP